MTAAALVDGNASRDPLLAGRSYDARQRLLAFRLGNVSAALVAFSAHGRFRWWDLRKLPLRLTPKSSLARHRLLPVRDFKREGQSALAPVDEDRGVQRRIHSVYILRVMVVHPQLLYF